MIKYKNIFENKGNYYIIHCYNKNDNFVGNILFDSSDLEIISKYKWHIEINTHRGIKYAVCTQNRRTVRMHRLLLPNSIQVDHINHNGLDNRRENLRPCNNRENNCNKKHSPNRGIRYHKNGRFYVRIMVNKREISLGAYSTLEEAREARSKAEDKYFKEFKYKYNL